MMAYAKMGQMGPGRNGNWTLPLVLYPVLLACALAAALFAANSLFLLLMLLATALVGAAAIFSMPGRHDALKLPMVIACALLAAFEGLVLHIHAMQEADAIPAAAMIPLTLADQPTALGDLFRTDFPGTIKFAFETDNTIRDKETDRTITGHVYSTARANADAKATTKFYAFYIPQTQPVDTSYQLAASLTQAPPYVDAQLRSEVQANPGNNADLVNLEILPFSRVIYIYHDAPYSADQIRTLTEKFAKAGLQLHLRDQAYARDRWAAWKTLAPRPL